MKTKNVWDEVIEWAKSANYFCDRHEQEREITIEYRIFLPDKKAKTLYSYFTFGLRKDNNEIEIIDKEEYSFRSIQPISAIYVDSIFGERSFPDSIADKIIAIYLEKKMSNTLERLKIK